MFADKEVLGMENLHVNRVLDIKQSNNLIDCKLEILCKFSYVD
jgi:hypothetical protein